MREQRINIAELLKHCPTGMELDCTIFEDVTLYKIDVSPENEYPIRIETKNGSFLDLTKHGTYSNIEEAKCVIFPKGKTTWEGFQRPFKDGDIVVYDNTYREHLQIFIFKDKKGNNTLSTCYLMLDGDELDLEEGMYYVTRLATEEEKQKLFEAIKDNGYKWDEETKTLERIKKEYPKTYKECFNVCFGNKHHIIQVVGLDGLGDNKELFESFIKLKICRDAYWKIYGEEMGLGKSWEPDWTTFEGMPAIFRFRYNIVCDSIKSQHCLLVFPTVEMRNSFYENFKDLIEQCKELL